MLSTQASDTLKSEQTQSNIARVDETDADDNHDDDHKHATTKATKVPNRKGRIEHPLTCYLDESSKQTLYKIIYFIVRYLIVLTTIFLSLLSCIYGVSALITTEAINFFCDYKTAEEVHERNFAVGYNDGEPDSCWRIDRPTLDFGAISTLDMDIYESKIDDQSFATICACIIFSLLALFLLFIGISNGYYVIYDTFYSFINKPNPRVVSVIIEYENEFNIRKKSISTKMAEKNDKSCCKKFLIWGEFFYDKYGYYSEKYFYFDSRSKIYSCIFGEIIEISVQFYGLCLYGGLNLIDITKNDNNDIQVFLGQEYYVVESFAIIVGANCILTGLSWLIYIIWHNTWYVKITLAIGF